MDFKSKSGLFSIKEVYLFNCLNLFSSFKHSSSSISIFPIDTIGLVGDCKLCCEELKRGIVGVIDVSRNARAV